MSKGSSEGRKGKREDTNKKRLVGFFRKFQIKVSIVNGLIFDYRRVTRVL